MSAPRIALIGDHDPSITAHQGIPLALAIAAEAVGACEWEWLHTATLPDDPSEQLAGFQGIWCVPGSPYANTHGALGAIRWARQTGQPFLGTCGGFQHALLEYAEAVWGVAGAAHAEVDPGAINPVITPLTCDMGEQPGQIWFRHGSRLAAIYGAETVMEGYHCRYGLNPNYANRLVVGPLMASGHDGAGDVRAVELEGHPFFIATLFQPERSGLANSRHPLITAFVAAARSISS